MTVDLSWVEQVITIYVNDEDALRATLENPGWQLIATGNGISGVTTLTFGWPAPDSNVAKE